MRILRFLIAIVIILASLEAYSQDTDERDVLFQVSTIDALLVGVYDGSTTFDELARHGDFGIGTFNHLDGEMIALNGQFYRIRTDGKAYKVLGEEKTPFAAVTFFSADRTSDIADVENLQQLKELLDSFILTKNIFYAIKIEGNFKYVKTRSVPLQEKPYPPLVDVIKDQAIFEFHDVRGTIVGFWCPAYVKGINVSGYHLHFITEDASSGGHLLECEVEDAVASADNSSSFFMVLPEGEEFRTADLAGDKGAKLHKVEKE